MTPERWKQIDQLYDAALKLDVSRRAAFLDQACAGDEELRREVASLLAADAQAGSFLGAPAAQIMAKAMAAEIAPSPIGRRIGHYRVQSLLGAGGMGEIYLAEDTQLGRKVALKLLPVEFTADAGRVRRFAQEARAASALNHPNIITIHEIGEASTENGATHYIVTEYVEGETLRQRMASAPQKEVKPRIEASEAIDIALQIAAALVAAHEAGIVHRDIKPENVMVRRDGLIKVLDFGLAKLTGMRNAEWGMRNEEAETVAQTPRDIPHSAFRIPHSTAPGVVMGTPRYMSPEQARGQEVDARSDLFSLGIVLYEMHAGRAPFTGTTIADILVAILSTEPLPLARYSSDVPAELERIVSRCLVKQREQRYQSAKELLVDLKALAAQLLQPQTAPTSSPSIAVLPFVNISADTENEYFCDGLAEELINVLTKIEALRVVARTSAFSFKGKDTDVREIGRKLNVGAVLEGSVRKAGNRLRITAQLVNVEDGYHLWSERYDRQMDDIFDIQDEISLAIVDVLKVKLLGAENVAVLKRYTENTEAYQLCLKGRYHYGKWNEEGWKKAIEYFKQAIDKEPNYAPAFAGLANSYLNLWWSSSQLSPHESVPKAKAAAARALAIDSALAESHLSLARLKFWYEWDWMEAEREFKKAIELSSNFAEAHDEYGLSLAAMGRAAEAIAEGGRSLELDPLSLVSNLNVGWIFWCIGQYDRMHEQGRKLIDLEPNFFGGHWLIGSEFWTKGRYEQAISKCQTAVALGGGPNILSNLGCLYGLVGERDRAQQVLEELQKLSTRGYLLPHPIALVYAGLGEMDRAFAWLEQAYEQREGLLLTLKYTAARIPGLSADPRLADLLRRIGLP